MSHFYAIIHRRFSRFIMRHKSTGSDRFGVCCKRTVENQKSSMYYLI
jgi:hypothetical protein